MRVSCHARAGLLAVVASLWWAAPAAAQNYHFGMNTRVLTPPMADKMVELGAGTVRLAFGWDVIEPNCKGCFNWTTTDAWRDEAKRTHRTIFASLAYAPAWANGGHEYWFPPLNYQDWYDFVFAVVSRYRDDIYIWGVWNEPNLDNYLHGSDVRVYQSLAINARAAIRAANPDAVIVGPDVSWHGIANGWFAEAMAAVGDLFDIVSVHWYVDGPPLDYLMDKLVRPFSRGKPVWLAEVGKKPCASFFGEGGQALFYAQVLEAFQARRDWWTGISFYDLWEDPTPPDCGSAITRTDWSNRPAFTVLQNFIRAHP
jgi:polysaccharide biosynthesis protein PslG